MFSAPPWRAEIVGVDFEAETAVVVPVELPAGFAEGSRSNAINTDIPSL